MIELQNEVRKLRKNLDEAVQTRDLYNVCISCLLFTGSKLKKEIINLLQCYRSLTSFLFCFRLQELLVQSNELLEKMSTEKGLCPAPMVCLCCSLLLLLSSLLFCHAVLFCSFPGVRRERSGREGMKTGGGDFRGRVKRLCRRLCSHLSLPR